MTEPGNARTEPTNRLARETSAYLRQHMHNPVDWYAFGPEAFEKARAEEKPVLVSIGYSACHWCHVMAHESFEHEETAALMNALLVNVKVDREERPDVDQVFMDTLVRLTGHGGWPLTVFCTPEGKPFYAGTYYPREPRGPGPTFRQLLRSIDEAWRERRGEVEHGASEILAALAVRPAGRASSTPGVAHLVDGARKLMQGADLQHGGFGGGPKFPTPTNLELLLAALDHLPEIEASHVRKHCLYTAIEMARRGLYDHLGGGFHRYCVDGEWTIPHFEKMLYDQGLLLQVYAELLRRTNDAELLWPMEETVAYLRREMTAPEGGYYASQDADSEGEEGKFYVFKPPEIEAVLGDGAAAFARAYGITERGNFEHGTTHLIDLARRPREIFAAERARLLAARNERIAPATDTKRVTSWNGYVISGLARAASATGDGSMLADAARAADFVLEHLLDPQGRLLRVRAEGRAHVVAFLDDHAAMLNAFLDLFRAGAGAHYLAHALSIGRAICRRFYDEAEADLFLTPSDGEPLPHRPRSDNDGATPQATGLAVIGLVRAALLCEDSEFERVARGVLETHAFVLESAPHGFPTLLRAAALAEHGLSVVVVIGSPGEPSTQALLAAARRTLGPEDAVVFRAPGEPAPEGVAPSWFAGREAASGCATAWVCRGTTCSLPIHEPAGFNPALRA